MSEQTTTPWKKEQPLTQEYAFSFAIVGDTQNLSMLDGGTKPCGRPDYPIPDAWRGQDYLGRLYGWIVENKEKQKIAHAFILGDITENINQPEEWAVAEKAIPKLNGRVEYSAVRGNHDHPDNYYALFDRAPYRDTLEGCFAPQRVRSAYKTFEVEGVKYLSLMLDHSCKDEVLEWADGVLSAFPDHRAIMVIHTYLDGDGNLITHEKNAPATPLKNDGTEIWNKLLRRHKNLYMTLSGHYGVRGPRFSQSVGDHGNRVLNVMVDSEGIDLYSDTPGAMVLMAYFAKDGKSIEFRYYSVARDEFYGDGKRVDLGNF